MVDGLPAVVGREAVDELDLACFLSISTSTPCSM